MRPRARDTPWPSAWSIARRVRAWLAPGMAHLGWRKAAVALTSLACLAAAPASTRVIALPERADIPAHAVRLRFWTGDGDAPRPLLIYEPGWNGSADENSILLASLAGAGFDVVALDLAAPQPEAFADTAARLARPMDLSSFAGLDRTVAEGNWRVGVLAQDAIESLHSIPQAAAAPSLGIMGYSFGGAVAAEMCRLDQRFSACLNMDGWLFGAAADHPGPQPYMLMSGEAYPAAPVLARSPSAVMDERDAVRLRARMAMAGGWYVQVAGLQHGSFSDGGGGSPAVRALARAFFDQALRHQPSSLLASTHPLDGVTLTRSVPGAVAPLR